MPKAAPDFTGMTFGRLTVLARSQQKDRRGGSIWECRCICGELKLVKRGSLRSGNTQSCGCLHRERNVAYHLKHGRHNTAEHRVWRAMKERCSNPNKESYKNYGARGISVCERWSTSFQNFFDDMGMRPTARHSIDRINNNGNYEPENCRWATPLEQAANKRRPIRNRSTAQPAA